MHFSNIFTHALFGTVQTAVFGYLCLYGHMNAKNPPKILSWALGTAVTSGYFFPNYPKECYKEYSVRTVRTIFSTNYLYRWQPIQLPILTSHLSTHLLEDIYKILTSWNVTNAYPLGCPANAPDLWKIMSNFSICPHFCAIFKSWYQFFRNWNK